MPVIGISNSENIVDKTQVPESYIAAYVSPTRHQAQAAELSAQLDIGPSHYKDGVEQPIKFPKEISASSWLHSLLVNVLNHIVVTSLKKAMMQSIEETLAKNWSQVSKLQISE